LKKRNVLIIPMVLIMTASIASQAKETGLSFDFEFMGTSVINSINVAYSINKNIDVGLGLTPSIVFAPELDAYAKWNILDYFITPYLQLSSIVMYPGSINNCPDIFFSRVHAGVGAQFDFGLHFGISIGYQFLGSHEILYFPQYGIVPGAYIGWKIFLGNKEEDKVPVVDP
jgi:hypothetical protein